VNQLSDPHQKIQDLINPAGSRRALVVEGPDDKPFYERQLDAAHPTWRSTWIVGVATGKQRVLDILKLEPTWIGVADTDESDATATAAYRVQHPNLHFTPRYCMESYYVLAAELWALLPTAIRASFPGGLPAFTAAINAPLDQWVRHGALWRVINPLWKGIRTRGFVDSLLDFNAAQNDGQIQATLAAWDAYLDPARLFADFQNELVAANGLPVDERLKTIVHGKHFFEDHVRVVLNNLFRRGQPAWGHADWLNDLRKSQPAHSDFAPLWAAMQLP
jgi:hypothetical protein